MKKITYTTEQKNAALEMVKAGTPVRTVAETTGISHVTIYKTIKQVMPEFLALRKQEKRKEFEERKAQKNAMKIQVEKKRTLSVLLYKEGYTHAKIAEMIGCPVKDVDTYIKEFRKANPGFQTLTTLNRLERDKNICELRNAGKTYKAIGEIIGIPDKTVYWVCSKYGITAPAKRARRDNGEIPQEILAPLVEYMRKFISAEFADKVQELAKNMVA